MNSAVRTAPLVADSVTAAGDTSTPAANLIRIAADRLPGGKPAPIDGFLPRRSAHSSCSFERSPTHNLGGYSSERNPFSVQFGADLVARASSLVGHFVHSSFFTPTPEACSIPV